MPAIENVLDIPNRIGECPVWSTAETVLYWAGIDDKQIHRFDPTTGVNESRPLPGRPGSFVLTDRPQRLVVAMEHELVRFDWRSGETTPWLTLTDVGWPHRMNDGRCDPAGRFVVGGMSEASPERLPTSSVFQIAGDGSVEVIDSGIRVSNGIAFDADRGRMYFADSPTDMVWMWDYDAETGARRNRRLFLDYSSLPGSPDGACVDADGCYWSASVHGWAVVRVTPEGAIDRRIELPVPMPTMPAFGGPDLDTLFVTSIGVRTGPDPAHDGFTSGCLLAIDAGVQGRPEPLFAGG